MSNRFAVAMLGTRESLNRDWFPAVTSFIPIPIEDTDWAALIGTTFSQQPSAATTWVAFFRSEEGSWKLLGVSGGEGLLE